MARPLHQLTKKGEAWRWTEDGQEAFEEHKQLITSTPILVQPNENMHFQLEMDMSRYAMGLFYPNCVRMTSASNRVHVQKPQMQKGTMKSMTRNSYQSSKDWRNGDTFWKELSTQ